jgi:hypothetical protein
MLLTLFDQLLNLSGIYATRRNFCYKNNHILVSLVRSIQFNFNPGCSAFGFTTFGPVSFFSQDPNQRAYLDPQTFSGKL